MSGRIIDASLMAAPRQCNTEDEKAAIKAGEIPEDWQDQPAKLRQKDRDARWMVKFTTAKTKPDGSTPPVDLAIPAFGYKNHIAIDQHRGSIRTWAALNAARHDGAHLIGLIDKSNTAGGVWADTAYRSKKNEARFAGNGMRSCVHRRTPQGRPMPRRTARANAARSGVRSAIEHVFARQTGPMGLFVRTIGIARATTKIGLANLAYKTLTSVYNVLTALRGGRTLTPAEQDIHNAGHVSILRALHDRLDEAVVGSYRWPTDLPDAEIVARIVALNAEWVAEEAAGKVRWLRPGFRAPKRCAEWPCNRNSRSGPPPRSRRRTCD